MDRLIWDSLWLSARALTWAAIAPLWAARQLYWLTGQMAGVWELATRDVMGCPGCGTGVALTGRWECGRCLYVFDGFAFARCAVCGAVPPFIQCQACGVGLRNPLANHVNRQR